MSMSGLVLTFSLEADGLDPLTVTTKPIDVIRFEEHVGPLTEGMSYDRMARLAHIAALRVGWTHHTEFDKFVEGLTVMDMKQGRPEPHPPA